MTASDPSPYIPVGVAEAVEQQLRLLPDYLPHIIWTARPDGWHQYYNQQWFTYTGLSLEQTQGWGWATALHPDDLQVASTNGTMPFTVRKAIKLPIATSEWTAYIAGILGERNPYEMRKGAWFCGWGPAPI